ncbi:pilus assembly protein PilW [Pseudomonas cremoricolorata]|uniref:Pilus assembly protein PilW n=1 Tax=Pseudomonas cremoricolorata TaxID=157783 RepID=A0A089Y8K0_9PSED|nr:prepilin-type N-terminal cleavage/methylation domain-containing protein [Pseudomonas cremoricolorata]AIR88148.1 pilus assembly protein PilW [Pseudomonas cremoricolorata]
MSVRQRGFGLLETLLAVALGAMVLAGVSQLFAAAYQAWRWQGAALQMQGDARLVLKRMAEDIRMAGMFGCLQLDDADFASATAAQAFAAPVRIAAGQLSLVVAELPGHSGAADWTLLTDCQSTARVEDGRALGDAGRMAIPISRLVYQLSGTSLMLVRGRSRQPLLEDVRALRVWQLEDGRIELELELHQTAHALTQYHRLSVALRNGPMAP